MKEDQMIQTIIQLAKVARHEGLRGVLPLTEMMPDAFSRRGVKLLGLGAEPDDIRSLLGVEAERDARIKRLVIEGLAGIADGENPEVLEARLRLIAGLEKACNQLALAQKT
ncbi:hypothetical protein THIX_60502 [Thiomonas sp. X19]|uniref:hypothetical protein n=1 Tax=Thiomonas sp. X19 TaxID=1050370 RepID=UPI000B647D8A|nr:hypothetical protein [Thiomonas sp. X19]SCC94444.1 hypothetical protein THIX_60502 [Thiomonas sp. X19]